MWTRPRDWRLGTKLAIGYVGLSACITLLCLLGTRYVQNRAQEARAYRAEIVHRASEIDALVSAGSEEGYEYVLRGEKEEREKSAARFETALVEAKGLALEPRLTPDERILLERAAAGVETLQSAATRFFDDFEQTHGVTEERYRAYENGIDASSDELSAFRARALQVTATDAKNAQRTSDALTVLVGLAAMVVAVVMSRGLQRRIVKPVLVLRDAAIAFGGGELATEVEASSGDEIGELTVAFDTMMKGTRLNIEAIRNAQKRLESDFKERERLEGALRQAQKMEAIGRVAGGVAHDFNNLLSIILGYSTMALEGMSAEDPMFVPLTEIKQAGDRSTELTGQLLAFSRHQPVEKQMMDVCAIVDSMSRTLDRVVGEAIEISTERDVGPCNVEVAPGQIAQILMNLVVNARDAMPRGGSLRIHVHQVDIDEEGAAKRVGMRVGRHVVLRVSDSGEGMSAETLDRIFEPFFTTKAVGKGTGLGLATVFGIVQQCGGHIGVESRPGLGTAFEIHLPAAQDPLDEPAARARPPERVSSLVRASGLSSHVSSASAA
jgi:signal transduction histidine kinase